MSNFGKLNFSTSFNPTSAFPLDARSYFDNYNEAVNAAKSAANVGSADSIYYIGQELVVVENGFAKVYIIQPDKTLKRIDNNVYNGLPVYTQAMIDSMGDPPDKYIFVPELSTDLTNQASREVPTNGNYVDILFSAIRKLQSEVARMRNAFQFGMYSYNGENTAMSRVIKGISDPDDEPLWAIEEEDLSLLQSLVIGLGSGIEPESVVDSSVSGILKINGVGTWSDTTNPLSEITDPKLFCFITSNKLTIKIHLGGTKDATIDLSKLNIPTADVYNIMLVISRKSTYVEGTQLYGENYIYVSVGNADRSQTLKEGFLNESLTAILENKTNLANSYYIKQAEFDTLHLSKYNIYSRYQDFSQQVIPSAPSDEFYKYEVAHITIRSVKNEEVLKSIKDFLPNNELIFVESNNKLWIKNKDKLITIGSSTGSGGETGGGMTQTEVINLLKEMGIVKEDGQNLQINDLSDLTFIHQETGNRFKFSVDSEGNLQSTKLPKQKELLTERIKNSEVVLNENVRGFIGQLRIAENNKDSNNVDIAITQDARIYADRVKIGAFYAPLDTDTVFGCSRAFVELENTADCDFNLQGCYLHFTCPNNLNEQVVYHLPLTGTIKAGSTYLIVGKKYSNIEDSSTQIKITSYDQEWFNKGKLIDFTINTNSDKGYGLALTYGNENLGANDYLYRASDSNSLSNLGITSGSKFPYIYNSSFIDAIYFYKDVKDASQKGYWAAMNLPIKSNTMYKNMFELDPAKQAFQSCNTSDSSRNRWKSANDTWILDLSKPEIAFPHSDKTYPISKFTPKSSKESKNVQTDKSKLNLERPNMVNCSFGTNIYTDRCFNWISAGVYDEYIWLRKKGTETWDYAFESYRLQEEESPQRLFVSYPARKVYSKELNNAAYARIINRFPADNTQYTAHKCVIKLAADAPAQPETWEYVVGRRSLSGGPDLEHTSNIQTFTLYPKTYTPRIYQTTDQQGFHWVEYQVWAAAANKLYEKIKADQKQEQIIPILINTGDMTQNGTRISEWFDYYTGGEKLLKEFEHMAVVGNNDLCNTNVNDLGTGDDQGKSNSFYFHVFYCYDIDESVFKPIVNGKYIPSLYFFDSQDFRFVNVNSEITVVNCAQWFNLIEGQDVVNIYTGFTVGSEKKYIGTFTSIYTMLFNILTTSKKCIVSCHEMPFTVITNESISNGQEKFSRSLSKANALVGSHMNQISNADIGKGTYWFSRLLEFKKVKLVLGGHKHTYACTYPLREYFYFGDNKNSKDNFDEYTMEETLQNDAVIWEHADKDLTKFPLTRRPDAGQASTGFYPYTPVSNLAGGVVYFMCQATGYKLTSNKELPSANQKFSMAVPQTSNSGGSDKANNNQKYPMFGIVKLNPSTYDVQLVRVANIFNSGFKFAQNVYSTDDMKLQYFETVAGNDYGKWSDTEKTMITV